MQATGTMCVYRNHFCSSAHRVFRLSPHLFLLVYIFTTETVQYQEQQNTFLERYARTRVDARYTIHSRLCCQDTFVFYSIFTTLTLFPQSLSIPFEATVTPHAHITTAISEPMQKQTKKERKKILSPSKNGWCQTKKCTTDLEMHGTSIASRDLW